MGRSAKKKNSLSDREHFRWEVWAAPAARRQCSQGCHSPPAGEVNTQPPEDNCPRSESSRHSLHSGPTLPYKGLRRGGRNQAHQAAVSAGLHGPCQESLLNLGRGFPCAFSRPYIFPPASDCTRCINQLSIKSPRCSSSCGLQTWK